MLSIIIPTLNEEKYLPLLLESIKKQDFSDYEIIVADAGSKDRTIDIAKEYDCKVVGGGLLPAGRNRGAETANGDIFLFLDSDVVLPQSFLKKSVEEFKRRNLGISGFPIFPLNGKKIDNFWFKFFNLYSWIIQKVSPHSVAAIMARRDVHKKVGGFDEEIVFVEDYSYTKNTAKFSKYGLIKAPFFVSIRRFEKDGRFSVYVKYTIAELHVLFLGPIKSNIFNYKFGHYNEKKNKESKT